MFRKLHLSPLSYVNAQRILYMYIVHGRCRPRIAVT